MDLQRYLITTHFLVFSDETVLLSYIRALMRSLSPFIPYQLLYKLAWNTEYAASGFIPLLRLCIKTFCLSWSCNTETQPHKCVRSNSMHPWVLKKGPGRLCHCLSILKAVKREGVLFIRAWGYRKRSNGFKLGIPVLQIETQLFQHSICRFLPNTWD